MRAYIVIYVEYNEGISIWSTWSTEEAAWEEVERLNIAGSVDSNNGEYDVVATEVDESSDTWIR